MLREERVVLWSFRTGVRRFAEDGLLGGCLPKGSEAAVPRGTIGSVDCLLAVGVFLEVQTVTQSTALGVKRRCSTWNSPFGGIRGDFDCDKG